MSSTSRGGQREASDYYATPHWAIQEFLTAFTLRHPERRWGGVLDPCAGGDAERPMAYPHVLLESKLVTPGQLTTLDIRDDSQAQWKGLKFDFLNIHPAELAKSDTIISNPPFALAERFIIQAEQFLQPGGALIFLLRLNFLEGQKRRRLFQAWMPSEIYVHSKRMGFMPPKVGQRTVTDSVAYAHFVWFKGRSPDAAELRVIGGGE